MKFPNLETMVMYGIYTVKDLIMYSQNKLVKRKVKTLNECVHCSFVYCGNACNNCNDIKTNSLV